MSARIRTGYSFRSAFGHIGDVIDKVQLAGLKKAPITDTASTFGFVRWSKACKKAGIEPVFGVELAVTNSINAKKPSVDHWTFIAKSELKSINRLVETATSQFRYRPLLTIEQAESAIDTFTIIGEVTDLSLVKPNDHIFVALGPFLSKGQYNRAKRNGFKFIACCDNRYPSEDDQKAYEIACGFNASTQTYNQSIMSDDEWLSATTVCTEEEKQEAIRNRDFVFDNSTATLQSGTLVEPERELPLEEMCQIGAEKLGIDLSDEVYKERLERELRLISEKKFGDYFYIIADICKWARSKMIVGPARGSSCGSLVCYLLEITTIDPIPYGLIFERFIDLNRDDLPDIDIDFSDQKRQLVFDYISTKYGSERVARLGTVAMYRPKNSLNEAGSALDIPPWEISKISDAAIDRPDGDARAMMIIEDTLKGTDAGHKAMKKWPEIETAARLEGHPRHSSQHAAGIVITQEPIREYVALDNRTGAIQCDKKDAEALDLLKIDALGLIQLSVFEDTLEMAGLPHTHLETVPLDDPLAFQILNDKKFSGVFQFTGPALKSIVEQITVESLEDMISVTALARPGPMASGGTNEWARRRSSGVQPAGIHPMLDDLTKETLGIMTYQEQVMRIVREMGGLSWAETSLVRKAMSKSLGDEFFEQFRIKFISGAKSNGVDEDAANEIWKQINTFGSWAFNKSHSVAYGVVSYWSCWLKAHYPLEFAAASLTSMKDHEKQIQLLKELQSEGFDYIPADKDISTDKWAVGIKDGKKALVGPLSSVKGIGPKLEQQILSCRARGEEIPDRAKKLLESPETKIDTIWPVTDRFKELLPDPSEKNIFTPPTNIADLQVNGAMQQGVMVFCKIDVINPKDENSHEAVTKRGYKFKGPTQALNLWISDDTDKVFAKINRWDYQRLATQIIERGRTGKALYAIKGEVPKSFRMLSVKAIRYIGDMEQDNEN